GRMETLIELNPARHPHEDAKGHIDFRDLGIMRSVAPDTPLMRRHAPQPGTPGRTVTGAELAVATPKDVKFPVRLPGVQVSAADPDLLVAAIAGQPVLHRDGISVEPVLTLQNVDLATGNVDFVGTVEIKGDVQSGMKIKAGGDVIVHGILESAEVEAGGDVVVKGGIIGQKNHAHDKTADHKTTAARIHAKANVRAHHLENALVLAGQSVYVDEVAVQSDITAIDQVVIGTEGGRKGHILGGIVRATQGVTAECLGGPGTGETRIMIGVNPLLQQALDEKRTLVAAKLKEHDDLEKVVKVLQNRPDRLEMLEKARLTLGRTEEELAEATADANALEADIKQADNAEVVVKRAVFPGVSVTIGHRRKVVTEQRGPGTFRLVTETINGREEELVAYQ
ncbi:MAG: FapA family protein, partial [Rhodocyclaceae bacterium]|nr:FapA family protein [Rhodocyclaceae bacterium]